MRGAWRLPCAPTRQGRCRTRPRSSPQILRRIVRLAVSTLRGGRESADGAWAWITQGIEKRPPGRAWVSLSMPGVIAPLARLVSLLPRGALHPSAVWHAAQSPRGVTGLLCLVTVTGWLALFRGAWAGNLTTPRAPSRLAPLAVVARHSAGLLGVAAVWHSVWTRSPLMAAQRCTLWLIVLEVAAPWALAVVVRWARGGYREEGAPEAGVARSFREAVAHMLVGSQAGLQWDDSQVLSTPPLDDYADVSTDRQSVPELLSLLYPSQNWRDAIPETDVTDLRGIRMEVREERCLAWTAARPLRRGAAMREAAGAEGPGLRVCRMTIAFRVSAPQPALSRACGPAAGHAPGLGQVPRVRDHGPRRPRLPRALLPRAPPPRGLLGPPRGPAGRPRLAADPARAGGGGGAAPNHRGAALLPRHALAHAGEGRGRRRWWPRCSGGACPGPAGGLAKGRGRAGVFCGGRPSAPAPPPPGSAGAAAVHAGLAEVPVHASEPRVQARADGPHAARVPGDGAHGVGRNADDTAAG